MALQDTCPTFQANITKLATIASKTPDAVYELWQRYSNDCRNFDQSAILSEFIEWYRDDLGGDSTALRAAIQNA